MTKEILSNLCWFKIKDLYFSDHPYDVNDCDIVRFPLCKKKITNDDFIQKAGYNSIIDLTIDLEDIWKNFDRKSTRYSIKKAEIEGIDFRINKNFKEFLKIYKKFIIKKGYHSRFNFDNIDLKTIKKYGTLFTAEYYGMILGGHLYLEDRDNILLWISASNRLNVNKKMASLIGNSNCLLHWEAMKYAKEKGITEFNWGGLWSNTEAENDPLKKAINAFKLNFGGEISTCYTYSKIYSNLYRQISGLNHRVKSIIPKLYCSKIC